LNIYIDHLLINLLIISIRSQFKMFPQDKSLPVVSKYTIRSIRTQAMYSSHKWYKSLTNFFGCKPSIFHAQLWRLIYFGSCGTQMGGILFLRILTSLHVQG